MKKSIKGLFISCMCITAVFMAGFAFQSKAEEADTAPSSVRVYGTVGATSDGRLHINRQDSNMAGQELVITVSERTLILDAVNGYPGSLASIKAGETVYAYISPAMTMSLPPISNGELILYNIPADFKVPEYITVEALSINSDGVTGTVTSESGAVYTVSAECQTLPYLTRNIVRLPDLVKGKKCLVWTKAGSNDAYKIVAFADEEAAVTGWISKDDSWYYGNESGELHKGWLSDKGNWYYMNLETGKMQTGFLTVDGKTYFLQEDGKMLTKAKTFTPDENGALR